MLTLGSVEMKFNCFWFAGVGRRIAAYRDPISLRPVPARLSARAAAAAYERNRVPRNFRNVAPAPQPAASFPALEQQAAQEQQAALEQQVALEQQAALEVDEEAMDYPVPPQDVEEVMEVSPPAEPIARAAPRQRRPISPQPGPSRETFFVRTRKYTRMFRGEFS